MPRRVENVVVPEEWGGRDAGKIFRITEMPALQAEKWSWRLALALKGTRGEIPDETARFGMVGVAVRGINAVLAADVDFGKIEPLLDEMLACLARVRDPRHPDVATALLPDDFEEVRTLGWLRSEVLRVHTGFSAADALFRLISAWTAPSTSEDSTTT
jgi:hypothetical protein